MLHFSKSYPPKSDSSLLQDLLSHSPFSPSENTPDPGPPTTQQGLPQRRVLLYVNTPGHTLHQLFGGSAPPPLPGSNRAANERGGAVPAAFCLQRLFQNKQFQPSAGATGSQIKRIARPGRAGPCNRARGSHPHQQGNPCNLSCLFLHPGGLKPIFL